MPVPGYQRGMVYRRTPGVLGALVWHLPIYVVYGLVMLEEVYKAVLGYIRYRQKKWLRNLTVQVR